jgi:hypothetical protein
VVSRSTAIGLAGVAVAVAISATLQWQSRDHVTKAGFWFEHVAFDLPHLQAAGLGGPIDPREQTIIEETARRELAAAFAAFRIQIGTSRDAPYVVRVVQQFPASRRTPFGAAGESLVLAPLGGYGSVSFLMLGSLAIANAPPGATRGDIIEGIGRGIGRAAAHELAHQLLPGEPIHASTDDRSYEFELAARPGQYYGPIRWDIAGPLLSKRLGVRSGVN